MTILDIETVPAEAAAVPPPGCPAHRPAALDRGCPVRDYVTLSPLVPALASFREMDEHRAHARPALRSHDGGGDGYWVFTDHDAISDGLRRPDLWRNGAVLPIEPDPQYSMIPVMLNGHLHTQWRRLLAGWFTPRRVKGMLDEQRALAVELVASVRDRGGCDFLADVASVFPATIFLDMMGIPQDMRADLLEWTDQMLHLDLDRDPTQAIRFAAMGKVNGYFAELIAERRAHPDPDAHDIVSAAIGWTIDGEQVPDADILNCLLVLLGGGLDTVASEATYALLHLATHDADRRRLVADPDLVPHAIEEFLRVHPIAQVTRTATRDMEFHGCPVKKGDLALFPPAAAGRDEKVHPHADQVDLDRTDVRHLTFSAGPHFCIGAHLARQELMVLLQEWHRQIPEYELVEMPMESAGGVWTLTELTLRWTA